MIICSIYDSKASFYEHPFSSASRGEVLRGFINAIRNPQSDLSKFPQDYTLFELGTFDQQTGKITLHSAPQSLGNAIEFIHIKPESISPEISEPAPISRAKNAKTKKR